MTTSELSVRVTVESAIASGALALVALAGWGPGAAAGVAAAGALAILNFRWLARGAALAAGAGRERRPAAWALAAAGRFAAVLAVLAALLASGWVHPVGVVAGLTVLPLAVVVRGLGAARKEG